MNRTFTDTDPEVSTLQDVFRNFSRYWAVTFAVIAALLLMKAVNYFALAAEGSEQLTNISYLVAPIENYQADTIINDRVLPWKAAGNMNFPSPDVPHGVWLKIPIAPSTHDDTLFLRFTDPLIDLLDVYIVTESHNKQQITSELKGGDTRYFNTRELALAHNVVSLPFTTLPTTVYVYAQSKISINLHASLWRSATFIAFNNKHTVFLGLLFGYTLALICYCMMMFATVRKSEYLYYSGHLVGFFAHILAISSFGFQYMWPQNTQLQSVIGGTTICFMFILLVKFTVSLLGNTGPAFSRTCTALVYLSSVVVVLSMITLSPVFVMIGIGLVLLSACAMPPLCWFLSKANLAAKSVACLIWGILIATVILSLMERYNISESLADPLLILVVGFYLETMVIGLALLYHYRVSSDKTHQLKELVVKDKASAIQSKDAIVQLQSNAQRKLEQQVKAQTIQLEGALADLNRASGELESMRNLDGLTGLPNRFAFEETLNQYVKTAMDTRTPLCIAVLDIDHFKHINDTHGHLIGDECLRKFSSLFKHMFSQQEYNFCRFGGEEFMLASLLEPEEVENQLNQFREALAALIIDAASSPFSFTVSAGVASGYLEQSADVRGLMSKADHNLYIAKQKGRNLVIA
ncbi:MAG: diguanylate cyclase [Glaciecola sp.]